MNVEKFTITACCGRKSIIFKTDRPITMNLLNFLVQNGYTERSNFTKAGLLYVNNSHLIVTGPIGADKLQVRCIKDGCDELLNDFEELLTKME